MVRHIKKYLTKEYLTRNFIKFLWLLKRLDKLILACALIAAGYFVYGAAFLEFDPQLATLFSILLVSTGVAAILMDYWKTAWHILALMIVIISSIVSMWSFHSLTIENKVQALSDNIAAIDKKLKNNDSQDANRLDKIAQDSSKAVNAQIPDNVNQVDPPRKNRDSENKLQADYAKIGLTFIGVVFGLVGLFFGNKIKELFDMDKKLDEVSRLTVSNAELALAHLPNFTESHQISKSSYDVITSIDKIVFREDSYVLKYLDKVGNGSTLRFARAINYCAENDYPRAINTFEELLKKNLDTDLYCKVLYRLGIAYRQQGEYDKSIETFTQLHIGGDNNIKNQAEYGLALTIFAISINDKWLYYTEKTQNQIIKCLSKLKTGERNKGCERKLKLIPADLIGAASCLIDKVLKYQPMNYSALLYYVLIPGRYYYEKVEGHDIRVIVPRRVDEFSDAEITKQRLNLLLRFLRQDIPESLNIRANYFVVEALAMYSLGEDVTDIKDSLYYALTTANLCEEKDSCTGTIFSDLQVEQISASEFKYEVIALQQKLIANIAPNV